MSGPDKEGESIDEADSKPLKTAVSQSPAAGVVLKSVDSEEESMRLNSSELSDECNGVLSPALSSPNGELGEALEGTGATDGAHASSDEPGGDKADSFGNASTTKYLGGKPGNLNLGQLICLLLFKVLPFLWKKSLQYLSFVVLAGVVGLILCCLTVLLFGRQLVDVADAELKRHPYIAFPIKDFVDPFFEGSDSSKKLYQSAAKDVYSGWSCYLHWWGLPNNRQVPVKSNLYNHYGNRSSSTDIFKRALDKIGKLPKSTNTSPISFFAQYGLGLSRNDNVVIFGKDRLRDAELLAAASLAEKQMGPNNIFVGAINRDLAESYLVSPSKLALAEKFAQKALKADSSDKLGVVAVTADRKLLAKIALMNASFTESEKAWSELLSHEKQLYGDKSLAYASALLEHANHLVYRKMYVESLNEAERGFAILKQKSSNSSVFDFAHPAVEAFGLTLLPETDWKNSATLTDFLNLMGTERLYILSDPSAPASVRDKLHQIDADYVSWLEKTYTKNRPAITFNFLVKVADDYSAGKDYLTADKYYKRALKFGADNNMWVISKTTKTKLLPAKGSVEQYLLCMAKTVHNCFLQGDLAEGQTISWNMIDYMDPFKNWIASYKSYAVFRELTYAFGAVPVDKQSKEFKELQAKLIELIELKRIYLQKDDRDKAILIAEMYELQGDNRNAEKYYREAVQRDPKAPRNLGGLAAFLQKEGKTEEAGRLYEEAESMVYSQEQRKHPETITVLSDARLKALMDSSADKSYYSDTDFSWVPFINETYRAGFKTSAERGERFSIIDMRSYLHDFRKKSPPGPVGAPPPVVPGIVWDTVSARKDLASLSKEQQALIKKEYKWYEKCYPEKGVLRESLPDVQLTWFNTKPRSLRDLKPIRLLLISPADAESLKKMLGRDLTVDKTNPTIIRH